MSMHEPGAVPRRNTAIYVVSGGVGASGELLTQTMLAQFPDMHIPVKVFSHVNDPQEIDSIVTAAAGADTLIVHTMVNSVLRRHLVQEAARRNVTVIDLMGPLMDHLASRLERKPLGEPGLYRKLYDQYFRRVEAIEFTVSHDDGKRTSELPQAEIVLLGVSRVGKTPLSIYLAMQGWKVANVPFVPSVTLPEELWQLDRRRIVGLTIQPPQLMVHRRHRERRLGVSADAYVDRSRIVAELQEANRLFARYQLPVVDTTDKPIESSGAEIITIVTHRLGHMTEARLDY